MLVLNDNQTLSLSQKESLTRKISRLVCTIKINYRIKLIHIARYHQPTLSFRSPPFSPSSLYAFYEITGSVRIKMKWSQLISTSNRAKLVIINEIYPRRLSIANLFHKSFFYLHFFLLWFHFFLCALHRNNTVAWRCFSSWRWNNH